MNKIAFRVCNAAKIKCNAKIKPQLKYSLLVVYPEIETVI